MSRRLLLLLVACVGPSLFAQTTGNVHIPRVAVAPRLEDFQEMEPVGEWKDKLAKVEGFRQRTPSDGAVVTERTETYLGYDGRNLYVIFSCFDAHPERVRARLSRREDVFDDDFVEVMLDTFDDHRRAYAFFVNPLGVQADSLWTEGPDEEKNFDFSFDTVWNSAGKVTDQGYMVWMAIPFRSLRFGSSDPQTWGVMLGREILRKNEQAFWPGYSSRITGRLNQAGTATGMERIASGRNLQLIPYGIFRSFKELDLRDPSHPTYSQRSAFGQIGLDAKAVLKDKFVIDATVNPDFSQIESDEPEVTVNQRFEVFFPETRPFFQENSNYFQTPINLVFTRRIADPKWGVRVTGKDGPWAVGMLVADTKSPGEATSPDNPLFRRNALFAVGRASRDIGKQSTIGVLYADREVDGFFNRVGSIDGRFRINDHWVAGVQGAISATINPADPIFNLFNTSGRYQAGTAAEVTLQRDGRKLSYAMDYTDRSPNFRTLTGFDPQSDIHNLFQTVQYRFRPEGKRLISWGPMLETFQTFDHEGNRINSAYIPNLRAEFVGGTFVNVFYAKEMERLRPQDYGGLSAIRKYVRHTTGVSFETSYFRKFVLSARTRFGERLNYEAPGGLAPFLASRTSANVQLTVRPTAALRVDGEYLLLRLHQCGNCVAPAGGLNNHILRSRWNYQINKELSLRFIGQYNAVLANPGFTSLATKKNFDADFLITYLVHPSTALYVGYNSNLENIFSPLQANGGGGVLYDPRGRLRNDGRNFFVKASYLLRF